ncbi:MAG: hypothetical protein RR891_06120 [Clostridium sp.]
MELQTKRNFNVIAKEFESNNFKIETVSQIIVCLRKHKSDLTDQQAKTLLQIPIDVLENDVELKNEIKWQQENSSYFAGNITWADDDFKRLWKDKFTNKSYDLMDIAELCKTVANNFTKYREASEFLLRNVEVTLRDDVDIRSYSNFYKSGNVFSNEILNVIK